MKNIFAVALANLRKNKSQAVSLLAFALIAALLLNLGLLLMMRYGDFFDSKSEELHAPHYVLVEEQGLFDQSQVDYLKNYPGVTEVETESALIIEQTDLPYGDSSILSTVFFINSETQRNMNDLNLIEGAAPKSTNDICLPYMFHVGGGYETGDRYTIVADGTFFTFNICGFTEEIAFGSSTFTACQMYLSAPGFKDFLEKKPGLEGMVLRARMDDSRKSEALQIDCSKEFFFMTDVQGVSSMFSLSISHDIMKMMRTTVSSITSTITVIFAIMIVFVSALMVRFRIRNSIEESMTNIGALKAVGYTGRQLLYSIILQHCAIVVVGALLGIGISYTALPLVSQILEAQTALRWNQSIDIVTSMISFVANVLMVLLVTWLSARRIRRLQPLTALRQGIVTHSFKRNYFPLNRSRGSLPLLLAVKSSLQAKGQMIMIFVIIATITFMAVAGVSVYSNIGLHPMNFGKLVMGETPDAAFFVQDSDDAQTVKDYINKDDNVRKALYYDMPNVIIGDMEILNNVVENCSLLEGLMLYEGRYPKHNNEIAITNKLAQREDKGIGNTIKVAAAGKTEEYLVVGMIQAMNNGGYSCVMTVSGMKRMQPGYRPSTIFVYLEDTTKTDDLISTVKKEYGELLATSLNSQLYMENVLSSFGVIFKAVAFAIVGVTVLVILMVLLLLLKTAILRRRRELGIQKALGFTTFQLVNQFALNFVPVIALGVVAGGLGGVFGFNALFVFVVSGMGIMTASMPAPIDMALAVCAGLVIIAYIFAILISWRVRKISAYALVTE